MSIAPATEIVVSLMSEHADEQGTRQLQDDPRTYIYKTTNITLPDEVSVAVVENTEAVVNLALPYYDALDNNSALPLDDDALNSADGGVSALISGLVSQAAFSVAADESRSDEERARFSAIGIGHGLASAGGVASYFLRGFNFSSDS